MDQFKALVDNCGVSDWQKRLKAIEELQTWINKNSKKIKNASPGQFIAGSA
jgi:hypothetical protein